MDNDKKPNDSSTLWEKIQDFIYDSIDYIFMIIVIIIVGLIIYWRLGGLFGDTKLNRDEFLDNEKIVVAEDNNEPIKDDEDESDKTEDKKEDTDSKKKKEVIKFSIPKGSASQTIIDILLENKLIDDRKEFADYITKTKMETKLKYGNYEIPMGSSFDEIIEILTK